MPGEWKEGLDDKYKDHESLKDIKDLNGLADSFINAQSLLGNSIRVPGPDASADDLKTFHGKLMDKVPGLIPTPDPENAEAMAALYKKMGRPDDPAGYEHPEGIDATVMGDFAKLAHDLGMTKGQYSKMVGKLAEFTKTRDEGNQEAFNTAIRALKQKWGITYEDNLQLVNSVMKGTGAPKEMLELAANNKLPADAIEWLHNIGKQLGTEGINFDKDESTTRLAPQEAAARAAEIIGDRQGPYWDATHPEHKTYIQKYVDLMKAAQAGNA